MAGTGSYWGDIIVPIVAAWVGNKYGNPQGNTPNQYPAVLPPEVKRMVDEAWNVYKSGGSPIQQDIRDLAIQSAAQTPSGPSGFKFVSQELRDQPFAGGITAPKYDVSKLRSTPGNVAPPPPSKPPTYRSINPGPNDPNSKGRQPFNDIVPDLGNTIPGGRGGKNNDDGLQDPREGMVYGNPDFSKVSDAWTRYKAEHPNWAQLGANAAAIAIGAMTGLGGLVITPILRNLLLKDRPGNPAPPAGHPVGGKPGTIGYT